MKKKTFSCIIRAFKVQNYRFETSWLIFLKPSQKLKLGKSFFRENKRPRSQKNVDTFKSDQIKGIFTLLHRIPKAENGSFHSHIRITHLVL